MIFITGAARAIEGSQSAGFVVSADPPNHADVSLPGPKRSQRRAEVRRRRAVALITIATALILIVVILTGTSGASHRRPHPAARAAQRRRHRAVSGQLSLRENRAITALVRRQGFITAGGSERREIALTFDDGPGPYTPQLLEQLQRLHVTATFFTVGLMIHYFNSSLVREHEMGEVIGDHTAEHPLMAELTRRQQAAEILDQTDDLGRYGVPFPRLYRPPYGSFNAATFAILKRLDMLMVLWTVDTSDYLQPGVSAIVHSALAGAKPGAIILMHDAGGTRTQTIAALPLIVHGLRARGYRLVTVPRLVLDDPPPGRQPRPTSLAGD
jgi:peptidoglycan/xylan/chitin deacetylase (PgdA/CDA1 family)